MAEKDVKEIFAQLKSTYYKCESQTFEKKKCINELKLKVHASETQKNKLKEYIKVMETMKRKSSHFKEQISNLNSAIEEVTNSMKNTRKGIAILESQKKNEEKPSPSTKKIVTDTKTTLSEVHSISFDSLIQKENRLLELKKKNKELKNDLNTLEEKQELDSHIKEYELLKAKNMRLKEMIKMAIEQNI